MTRAVPRPQGDGFNVHPRGDGTAGPGPGRETFYGLFLLLVGTVGLGASLALSIEKIQKVQNPELDLSCDVSVLIQCSANLDSAQGALFGFPNPFLGLIGFALVLAAGAGVLATPAFARWFWIVFNAGTAGAFAFVLWLIGQSIFVLGTLCPWCLVVWSVTIPLFLFTTGRNLKQGVFGAVAGRIGRAIWPWLTLSTILAYLAVAVLAQLRLDVLASLVAGTVIGG